MGSGKSTVRKIAVQQLVAVSKNAKKNSKVLNGAIKLESVLHAFGHAAAQSSSDSSRYGLYSEYQYSASGRMIGVKTLDYLLEKHRVTKGHSLQDNERNFHIFYQLLGGLICVTYILVH